MLKMQWFSTKQGMDNEPRRVPGNLTNFPDKLPSTNILTQQKLEYVNCKIAIVTRICQMLELTVLVCPQLPDPSRWRNGTAVALENTILLCRCKMFPRPGQFSQRKCHRLLSHGHKTMVPLHSINSHLIFGLNIEQYDRDIKPVRCSSVPSVKQKGKSKRQKHNQSTLCFKK